MSSAYDGLTPAELWRHFAELNNIPRPSGKEEASRRYVQQVVDAAGATSKTDERGNLVVSVPARGAAANTPVVAIQAHLDMVCEKRPDVKHDFTTDPIRPYRDGDAIYASGTTLGADNGIGAAAGLAVLTDPDLVHGPVELIFTVEEETGLHGAMALDPSLVTARLLINLDSEDPKELTVGCAGGAGSTIKLPITSEPVPDGWAGRQVTVAGLKGGHSGVQIHEPLANAIKLLGLTLTHLYTDEIPFRLATCNGGNAHNAIPRDAAAWLATPPDAVAALDKAVAEMAEQFRTGWETDEPGLALTTQEAQTPSQVITDQECRRLLFLLDTLPHGVLAMSEYFPGKVETSANLARVDTHSSHIEIMSSYRSFKEESLQTVQSQIQAVGAEANAEIEARDGYPGWEPDPQSALLQRAKEVYQQMYGVEPDVQVVHAGLECGVIVSKIPGMEAISFGPRINGAHTPEEHIYISTVETTWKLLAALLKSLAT